VGKYLPAFFASEIAMASIDWALGAQALRASDEKLAAVIEAVGEPGLHFEPDAWRALSGAIMGQQISVHAARAIRARFAALDEARGYPLPAQVLETDDETLRACGLSRGKILSLRDLAAHLEDGRVQAERFHEMEDEAIIAALLPVRGIGRWTAEMFLIFSLKRPDVLAVDDLGLRNAMKKLYDLPEIPKPDVMREIAEKWRPFRSIASWYLWRSLES
jgi:DNA-3-methyladenine glycosylase II